MIGLTGEAEEAVNAYAGPKLEYYLALDQPQPAKDKAGAADPQPSVKEDASPASSLPDQTAEPATSRPGQGQYEASFGVWGWPGSPVAGRFGAMISANLSLPR